MTGKLIYKEGSYFIIPKDIIFNDEFLMNGMRPNIVTPENYGVICGPIIFAGVDSQTGDTISLTEEQVKKVIQYCNDNMLFNISPIDLCCVNTFPPTLPV